MVWLTFSGNQGVTNGIWNVLLYECSVSNESGLTAPNIENTPLLNWLQTVKYKNNDRYHSRRNVRKIIVVNI